jgi:hypothetical protein
MTEIVGDKGYHSTDVIVTVSAAEARSYIPEPKREGGRKWAGKAEEQKAVYANRRRVQGNYGKQLLKRRGELIERSFAHCYETGAMRRVYLRGRENISKRQLIHVGAFNLGLVLRKKLGAGTPRELRNRQRAVRFVFCSLVVVRRTLSAGSETNWRRNRRQLPVITPTNRQNCRRRNSGGSATGC